MILQLLFWPVFVLFAMEFILVGLFANRPRRDKKPALPRLGAVSVIIPFHNEEEHITGLLNSLNDQESWSPENELIFVDDASTDRTVTIIQEQLKRPYRIITQAQKAGKKQAIHAGIAEARHDFILTLDADVKFASTYFKTLPELPQTDMIILPVTMTGRTFFAKLASVEFSWLQLLTFGSNRPILSNGANLLFRKSAYNACHSARTDLQVASGDDIFLMQAFQKAGKEVHRFLDDDLAVTTPAHENVQSLLQQRRRWMSKFAGMANTTHIALSVLLISVQFAFLFAFVGMLWYPWFALLIALKFFAEFLAVMIYRHTGYSGIFWAVLVHQFWYPVYLLLLLTPGQPEKKWEQPVN